VHDAFYISKYYPLRVILLCLAGDACHLLSLGLVAQRSCRFILRVTPWQSAI
jgi:hypothetical protein